MDTVRASFGPSVAFVVRWKTFMIDPRTAAAGEDYMAYNRRRWGGDGWTYELRSRGAKAGAPFANWKWWPNTLRGHALGHYVRKHYGIVAEDELTKLLMELTYERGGNVSDPEELQAACKTLAERLPDLHMDVPAMQEAVRTRACVDDAWEEDEESKNRGVSGVPSFRISCEKVLPASRAVTMGGCQPVSSFVRVFERIISAAK